MKTWILAAAGMAAGLQGAAASVAGDQAYLRGDYLAAYQDWRSAAEAGDAAAMMAVGTLFDTGKGVRQDFAAALAWYRRAAQAGNVRGMFNTGAMYDNGRGVAVDRVQAVYWFKQAADRGDGRAAYALGTIYRDGDGVPRDRDLAIRAFRVAAAAGLEAARQNLVALNAAREKQKVAEMPPRPPPGTASSPAPPPPDMARYQKAALDRTAVDPRTASGLSGLKPSLTELVAQGDNLARYELGYAYENGLGVPRDAVRSYVLYVQAAASPDQAVRSAARRGAAEVGSKLTPDQHAAALAAMLDGVN